MQTPDTQTHERFKFLSEALNGSGGFAPQVLFSVDASGLSKPSAVTSKCHLIPYPRESGLKFAARAAVAVYENHLKSACERFVGYIAKRSPVRDGLNNPLIEAMVQDADWANNHIDVFWQSFMVEAKARGSMLLLIELPAEQGDTMQDALDRRLVPYLTAIEPERVTGFELNERKRFRWVKFSANMVIDGKDTAVDRYWDDQEWRVMIMDKVIESGPHPFGECPVLAFTETCAFPHVGSFAQIADLSRRIYNAISERDEILRSQTFSVLAYPIPADRAPTFSAEQVSATIGTNNMLIYEGDNPPAFIAPSDGPAATYAQAIEALQESIRRVGHAIDPHQGGNAESGMALTIRFQALNGVLSSFAQRMQDLELRMWQIVARYMGLRESPTVQWEADYSLADTERELSILAAMQATGFTSEALTEQRKRIAGQLFDTLDEDAMAGVMDSMNEAGQEIDLVEPPEGEAPEVPQVQPVDLSPVLDQIKALAAQVAAIPTEALEMPEPVEVEVKPDPAIEQIALQVTALAVSLKELKDKANEPLPKPAPLPLAPEPADLTPILTRMDSLAIQVAALAVRHEPQPVQSAPVFMIDPTSGNVTKQIQITRDAAGNITGASVAPQHGS